MKLLLASFDYNTIIHKKTLILIKGLQVAPVVLMDMRMSFSGHFLIARPVLQDPNFLQTVVFLLQHDATGAFGMVVNRPLPENVWSLPFPLYVGGPCKSEGLLMLHGHKDWLDEVTRAERQVIPGVFIGDESTIQKGTEEFNSKKPCRFLVITGYSGWGPGQLENEIREGAWAVVAGNHRVLFDVPDQEKWATLLPSIIPNPSMN